jgi:hypothetical protein
LSENPPPDSQSEPQDRYPGQLLVGDIEDDTEEEDGVESLDIEADLVFLEGRQTESIFRARYGSPEQDPNQVRAEQVLRDP